jgi:diguanylate cyclase (GGDEF)-like protein
MDKQKFDDLLAQEDLVRLLNALASFLKSPICLENTHGDIILGNSLSSWSQQIPLIQEQQTLGLLKGDSSSLIFSQLLSYLAAQEQLVLFDELTRIPNRRYYNRYFRQQWRRAIRTSTSLSLILCDVDFFKSFNDYYGHFMGDQCLRQVAQVLEKTIQRPTDFVARYGGEEFIVVLPDTDQAGGETMAKKLREAVANLRIPHHDSTVSQYVTMSLGIATIIPDASLSSSALVNQADTALYRAKAKGRNCYSV